MRICPKCVQTRGDNPFCWLCGAATAEGQRFCPTCGQVDQSPLHLFCSEDGAALVVRPLVEEGVR